MKKISLAAISVIYFAFSGCQDSAKNIQIDFVDRDAVFALGKTPNQLTLVVEIREDGKLSLNKIETGTIDDPRLLSETLEAIFADREKSGLVEREVVIEPKGGIKNRDLEKLIESLAEVKASPIRVIKTKL